MATLCLVTYLVGEEIFTQDLRTLARELVLRQKMILKLKFSSVADFLPMPKKNFWAKFRKIIFITS